MLKCSLGQCKKPPSGGFRELLDIHDASIVGLTIFWCKDHEEILEPTTWDKSGIYYLSEELPEV
jgi:hypothetical protein